MHLVESAPLSAVRVAMHGCRQLWRNFGAVHHSCPKSISSKNNHDQNQCCARVRRCILSAVSPAQVYPLLDRADVLDGPIKYVRRGPGSSVTPPLPAQAPALQPRGIGGATSRTSPLSACPAPSRVSRPRRRRCILLRSSGGSLRSPTDRGHVLSSNHHTRSRIIRTTPASSSSTCAPTPRRGWCPIANASPLCVSRTWFRAWGLGFRVGVWGLGFGVWGLGFGVWSLGFGVWGLRFGVWGLGFMGKGLGLRF